jgi:hypothetical protein
MARVSAIPRSTVLVTLMLLVVTRLATQCLAAEMQPTPLPPLRQQPVQNTQIVLNPSFEESDKSWSFSDWPPREKTSDRLIARSIFYSPDVVHTGRSALCFDLGTVGPERILAIHQGLTRAQLEPYEGCRLRLSAWLWIARGPGYYGADCNLRLWGDENTPLVAAPGFTVGGSQGEWQYGSREFTLRLGPTRRADVNVYLRNVPEAARAPVAYVDDVQLEVLTDPPLTVEALCGQTLSQPDDRLPLRVTLSAKAWEDGLRNLQWDVTSPDGLRSYRSGRIMVTDRKSVMEATLPNLAEGPFALRVALGKDAGDRTYEVLLPFRRAEGPFGH